MVMGPCHLYFVIADSAGNQSHSAEISLYTPGTTFMISEPIYADQGLNTRLILPFRVAGIVDVWAPGPLRVDLSAETFDIGPFSVAGMDFLPPPEASISGIAQVSVSSTSGGIGDILTLLDGQDAVFSPEDLASGHNHLGRSARSVSLASEGLSEGDPIARVLVDQTTLPALGLPFSRTSYQPGQGPDSLLLLRYDPNHASTNHATYWPIPGGSPTLVETGDATDARRVYDPASVGKITAIGVDTSVIGGKHTILGTGAIPSTVLTSLSVAPASVVGRAVSIGDRRTYDPLAVLIGVNTALSSGAAKTGVALGSDASYAPAQHAERATVIGSGQDVGATLYTNGPTISGDVLIGHLNSGALSDYDLLWGTTTVLSADPGFPRDGTHLTPTGPVLHDPPLRNNDSWLYTERYANWRRLGLTVAQANQGAALITHNTIVRRAADAPPTDLNFTRTEWGNWNLTAHNLFSRMQPIADNTGYNNGMVLVTVPNPSVPGDLQIDGDVTLSAPHHDGTGGAPGLLGFYGATAVARPLQVDDASIPALTSLTTALAKLGLILASGTPVVFDDFTRNAFSIDHSNTGQAPVGFPLDYSNVGSIGGNLARRPDAGAADGAWSSVLYYTDIFDVVVQATVVAFDGVNVGDDGILIRAIPAPTTFLDSRGQKYTYALLATASGLYQRNPAGTKTLIATYSSAAVSGDVLLVQAIARAITVKKNGTTILTHTMPDDLGGLMHGLSMNTHTLIGDLSIGHP